MPLEDPNLKDPVAQYDHDDGLSVIGGYMYYSSLVPEFRAFYVFGQDRDGEIYVLTSTALGPYGATGSVLKLVASP